ncbi:uncharacterized protein LOC119462202 [Dermacentor silvarum]|uniref:uncharacterized protein LOC119462202 n=1 Tax=Dermacentor silvarum TaxID=543639 RepID=UPI0021011191|nr:uncharacterized protein LOC119462202 [Dermacentor silvarum]
MKSWQPSRHDFNGENNRPGDGSQRFLTRAPEPLKVIHRTPDASVERPVADIRSPCLVSRSPFAQRKDYNDEELCHRVRRNVTVSCAARGSSAVPGWWRIWATRRRPSMWQANLSFWTTLRLRTSSVHQSSLPPDCPMCVT